MIEQYFQSHLNLLATLPFVENPQINFEKRADMVGFVRGAIEFTDGSALHYRELVDLRQPLRLVMYSYHYQGADGKLIFRYDNAAHHMQVNTFPHHKHIGDKDIVAAQAPGLEVVLLEVEGFMSAAR